MKGYEIVIRIKVPDGEHNDFDDQTHSLFERLCEIQGIEFAHLYRAGPRSHWREYTNQDDWREIIAEEDDEDSYIRPSQAAQPS